MLPVEEPQRPGCREDDQVGRESERRQRHGSEHEGDEATCRLKRVPARQGSGLASPGSVSEEFASSSLRTVSRQNRTPEACAARAIWCAATGAVIRRKITVATLRPTPRG